MALTINQRNEIVGLCANGHTCRAAAEIFNVRYPNRQPPLAHSTVYKIWHKFNATGSVIDRHRTGRPPKYNNENVVNGVLQLVNQNPHISSRALSAATHNSRNTVLRILQSRGFKPYKAQPHNKLFEGDNARRYEYTVDMIDQLNDRPESLYQILWTDESLFRFTHSFNRQNMR